MKVAFSTTKSNWISKLIIYFTKNFHNDPTQKPISHSFPILGKLHDVELGMSADEVMSNIVDIDRYRTPGHVLRVYELPDRKPVVFWVKEIISKVNQKNYGWFDLLWHVWRWFVLKIKKTYKGKNRIHMGKECMEVTAMAMILAGYGEYFVGVDINSMNAIELENIAKSIPDSVLVENLDT